MLMPQDKLKPPTAQRSRWYDAALGRFVSADNLVQDYANPQALNRFSYVVNNPMRLVDPSGNKFCDDIDGAGNCIQYEGSLVGGGSGQVVGSAEDGGQTYCDLRPENCKDEQEEESENSCVGIECDLNHGEDKCANAECYGFTFGNNRYLIHPDFFDPIIWWHLLDEGLVGLATISFGVGVLQVALGGEGISVGLATPIVVLVVVFVTLPAVGVGTFLVVNSVKEVSTTFVKTYQYRS